jgi:branched-chain amino acid transport system substrate-binding protein
MFFPLIVAAGCSSKPGTGPVWVGQLLPLEGANRTIGQHARQGVELAAADAQAAGHNVAGRPVAFLHVDSRGDAETVQAETVRLVTVNRAAALLADFDAALTERLLRANQSYGVPVIVPGELPAAADTDAVVALGVPPAVRGRLLARHAGGERRLPRVGVLTDSRRPVASALAAAFVKGWPGMRDAVEEWTFATDAEREERTTRLIQAAPAGILLACSVADFRALRPRLAAALPRAVLLYGGEDAGALPLQTEVEGSPEVDLATVYDTDHLSETGKAFARRYDERFHEPPDLYAAQAHDAARLLLDVMQHAGSSSKDALRKELTHLESFESATGPVQWKDRQPRRRVFLMTLKKGPAQVVQTIEPQDN